MLSLYKRVCIAYFLLQASIGATEDGLMTSELLERLFTGHIGEDVKKVSLATGINNIASSSNELRVMVALYPNVLGLLALQIQTFQTSMRHLRLYISILPLGRHKRSTCSIGN